MRNIYKTSNGLGNPLFKLAVGENACKIIFDDKGRIIKAFCGKPTNLVLVYSKDDADSNCLKDVMYEMLILSQECFLEMFNEIKSQSQLVFAKEVVAKRSKELKKEASEALSIASTLDSLL